MSLSGIRPSYTVHKTDWLLNRGFDFKTFDAVLDYKQEKGDIVIMTYPKCGTTWTQYIVYLLMNNCKPIPKDKDLYDVVPFLELNFEDLSKLSRPRAMKVHVSFKVFPYSEEAKYICVVRNPRDCCVSYYHHAEGFQDCYDFKGGKFEDFFESFMEGKIECGDYFDHLLSLYGYSKKRNVLFLVYEDMKRNPVGAVRKIADFISDLFPGLNFDDEFVAKVVRESSFAKMKEQEVDKCVSGERYDDASPFLRKGIVGDWVNYFTEEQLQRLQKKFAEKLNGSGAENLWSEYGI